MKDYADMSDFEVNNSIAVLIGIIPDEEQYHSYGDRSDGVLYQKGKKIVDYCNDARDMWPLIVENKMDICHIDSHNIWKAFAIKDSEIISYEDKNPLRAAAIVFLMLNERD